MPEEPKPIIDPQPEVLTTSVPTADQRSSKKKILVVLIVLAALIVAALVWLIFFKPAKKAVAPQAVTSANTQPTQSQAVKDYGNKYANGILPVGDNKYSTSTPATGTIYLCRVNAGDQGGAGTRGPWFINNNTQWDSTKKPSVAGSVSWTPQYSMTISGAKRVITTNDLPSHKTGVFPIASTDPVYKYDRNPNKISAQSLTYSLDANPAAQAKPGCIGGEVGVMNSGVALFDAFDAGYRDAGAWEVQDGCDGHPQVSGEYHYHTLSRCITTQSYQTIIGYALDGFPITGPKVSDNNIITTGDLDECHGMTGPISVDGKTVSMYHYVMTQDFPYSVSCFKGTPIDAPHPAGSAPQRP